MTRLNLIRKFSVVVFITFIVFLFVSSCEHEELMDSGVGPFQPGSVDSMAKFSWIQPNIFSQKCAVPGCHVQGTAAFGLVLSEGAAYGNLVDIPSGWDPSLLRVKPGDPDSSFLIIKLEGTSPLLQGQRMPLGRPMLPQEEIDAIRRWIRGATFNKVK